MKYVALAALCVAPMVLGASAMAANSLDSVQSYAGTWHASIVHYKTAYSAARTETHTIRNDCWRTGEYFACHQYVDGTPEALIVYTYDAAKDVYRVHAVPKDDTASPAGLLTISGNTWTFPWTDKDGDKTVYIRILNVFKDSNTIEFHQEYSLDQQHWVRTADGEEHRVAAGT